MSPDGEKFLHQTATDLTFNAPVEAHKLEKVEGGYLYGDHFIERWYANKWNVYPKSEYEQATSPLPDRSKAEYVGFKSLSEAKDFVDRKGLWEAREQFFTYKTGVPDRPFPFPSASR